VFTDLLAVLIPLYPKFAVTLVLLCMLVALLWGRWRYDLIALTALFAVVILGILPAEEVFLGFVHPVVVTVVSMLIISRALINAGIVDLITRKLAFFERFISLQLFVLLSLVAFVSAFIESVGALALFIPIAIRIAKRKGISPAALLLPVAFASHVGGYMTLIGAAPNLVIANARELATGVPFGMFDFSPVGVFLGIGGIFFMSFIGWRLVPKRISSAEVVSGEGKSYVTELSVTKDSPYVGKTLETLSLAVKDHFAVYAVIRNKRRIPYPSAYLTIAPRDVLVVQTDSEVLTTLIDVGGFRVVAPKAQDIPDPTLEPVEIVEAIVPPESSQLGKTPWDLHLTRVYGVSLLALHREGRSIETRIQNTPLISGDVLLLQGAHEKINTLLSNAGWYPLQEREFRFNPTRMTGAVLIFGGAVGISTVGLIDTHLIFAGAALVLAYMNYIPMKRLYENIDGAVVILLGAMLQLGRLFEETGMAQVVADGFLSISDHVTPFVMLGVILVGTMLISELLNSATVAVLMAPIAVLVAQGLGVSVDPFLIAVAIGAGSSYLTPFGSQVNLLVMNVGGYRFGDYWRLGLPMQIIIASSALPLIVHFWPL
jgi:di/tricarboxylate transporter